MNYQQKKKYLERASRIVGTNNPIGKLIAGYAKLCEANYLSSHFNEYFTPVIAESANIKQEAYKIRHQVYCDELGFEPLRQAGEEIDEFDKYSIPCLLRHNPTNVYAGTVRVVHSALDYEPLPIVKYCINAITDKNLHPDKFPRDQICEISRLAVPKSYRRREIDKFSGSATGSINEKTFSTEDLRYFPLIAVGLYFSAAAAVLEHSKIKHVYVMAEPRLTRSMRMIGIKFIQIGPVIDYHGQRAPYYIDPERLKYDLTEGFNKMLMDIRDKISNFH